jgi:hypothetical protein
MKKKFVSFLFFAMLIFSASGAWAIGIGLYGTAGLARDSIKLRDYDRNIITTHDYFGGVGLILDTAAAKDELFGYRLKLEYNQFNVKDIDSDITLKGYNYIGMYHTFGFGVIRTELVRFWIGPQIGLSYTFGRGNSKGISIPYITDTYKLKLNAVGVDALVAIGANFNVGHDISLFIDLAAGYMGKYNTTNKLLGHAIGFKASVGAMYRIEDNYKKI